MITKLATPLIFATALCLATPALALKPPADRGPISDFKLKSLKGKPVRLSDFKGKVVIVNFWATWCVPCLQELPHLNQYYKKHKDDGLVVLALTTDGPETMSKVRQTVKRKRFEMPILLDSDGAVNGVLNPRGTQPYTLFVDRNGNLAHVHEGYNSGDETKHLETIKQLLAEPGPS